MVLWLTGWLAAWMFGWLVGRLDGSLADRLLQKLHVTTEVATMLLEDLEELGAARASELTSEDWASLRVWAALRPLQKRRLLQST